MILLQAKFEARKMLRCLDTGLKRPIAIITSSVHGIRCHDDNTDARVMANERDQAVARALNHLGSTRELDSMTSRDQNRMSILIADYFSDVREYPENGKPIHSWHNQTLPQSMNNTTQILALTWMRTALKVRKQSN